MSYFNAAIPADTEAVALGASRIRGLAAALNPLIAQIFTDAGAFLTNWVTRLMIQSDPAVDANRAITANALANNSVSLRTLIAGLFTATPAGRAPFINQSISTAQLSADVTLTTSSSFTQPALNAQVTIPVTTDPIAAEFVTDTVQVVSAQAWTQPALNASVQITVLADPIAAGIAAGQTLELADGSGVDVYNVTAVANSPGLTVTATLVTIGGTNIAGTNFPIGTTLQVIGGSTRTVQITNAGSVDTYSVIGGTNAPSNQVTLELTTVGTGLSFTTTASYVQPAISATVVIAVNTDPVVAGVLVGQSFSIPDGGSVDVYTVEALDTTALTITGTLVSIGGSNTPGTTINSGTVITFSNVPGTVFASGTLLYSPGAILSASAAGRALMAPGFMTLGAFPEQMFTADDAGRAPFAPGFVNPELIGLGANPPDGFIKAKISIDPTVPATLKTVSAAVDLTNQVINVTGHGVVDATSLSTVQCVMFFSETTSPDSGSISPLSTATPYFVRVNDSNSLDVYADPTDAWNETNKITFTGNFGSAFQMGYFANPGYLYNVNFYIAPCPFYSGQALWCGYRLFFNNLTFGSENDYQAFLTWLPVSDGPSGSNRFKLNFFGNGGGGTATPGQYYIANLTSTYLDLIAYPLFSSATSPLYTVSPYTAKSGYFPLTSGASQPSDTQESQFILVTVV